jgi:intracellular sulfur oxidation DsrE/DsrF family protein
MGFIGKKMLLIRNLVILVLAAAVFWLAVDRLRRDQQQLAQAPVVTGQVLEPVVPAPEQDTQNFVADISVHTVEELEQLFARVEQALDRPRSGDEQALISLVLHGPEVEFFALKNYSTYRTVVDRAAKLAALGAVSISICQTQMRNYGIAPDEVPAFLHQVPFGPDEVQRLIDEGYVTM